MRLWNTSWCFSPPWNWVMYEQLHRTGEFVPVPERRPYWRIELWRAWDDDDLCGYWFFRIAGLEISGMYS